MEGEHHPVVIRRTPRDDSGAYRQRRGSIKSRIVQFSKVSCDYCFFLYAQWAILCTTNVLNFHNYSFLNHVAQMLDKVKLFNLLSTRQAKL